VRLIKIREEKCIGVTQRPAKEGGGVSRLWRNLKSVVVKKRMSQTGRVNLPELKQVR